MLLVAGGQLDPNIGALLRRCLAREIIFRDMLVGPDLTPGLHIDLDGKLTLNGEIIAATSCFLRHDVFLAQRSNTDENQRAGLNWYHAVRDWALGDQRIRLLNRHARSVDQGKYLTLRMARHAGLRIPPTIISNLAKISPVGEHIRKPVAGGELTELVIQKDARWSYPYFIQRRLSRPELRVYLIGSLCSGFALSSDDLDYRAHNRVEIVPAAVPCELAQGLRALCGQLGLDFAAADFMRDENGEWTFLEVNSQPMFAAFDVKVSGRLSDDLIDWLLAIDQTAKPTPSQFSAPTITNVHRTD